MNSFTDKQTLQYIHAPHFMIFSSEEGLLGCFPFLATVNSVAVKMAEEESVQ